ncbi:MAG: PIG-L family deacetylase [Edaphobacter sp.]|uniref:PIG-L deacetylase family protein n=1 Tax=Edaphobacter sp. TaxID=1934404 RepID=UPI002390B84B|nr:PIG-L family deacetylase [Edaphobacter sp.]MDE1175218.1 PIG-L family deacetylase [Edaphobacter sp.]
MCVVAHPDDECYAFGGALALAAERGVETYVVCMTDGQAARHRGKSSSGSDLGRMRRAEFAASCSVLGVTQHECLDYQDAEMTGVPFLEAAGRLVERIRRFRPNVVVTFGGDGGMNSHPDHMMVSFLTTAAFHWAAQEKRFPETGPTFRVDRLFHVTTDYFLPERQQPMPLPWSAVLDIRTVREKKNEAFRQHVSQAPLMESTLSFFEQHGGRELYALIAANKAQPSKQMTDLFEGLQ